MGRRYRLASKPKAYVERNRTGQFKDWKNIDRSLARDRATKGKIVKSGFGHQGDLKVNPSGKGWHLDSIRHQNAAKLGVAGPFYKKNPPRTKADWTKKGFYVKRDKKGEFKKFTNIGKSLAADRRVHAKNKVQPGYGDIGDQVKANPTHHITKGDLEYFKKQGVLQIGRNRELIYTPAMEKVAKSIRKNPTYSKINPQGKKKLPQVVLVP